MSPAQTSLTARVRLTPGWTPCPPDCQHVGPYRVHYLHHPDKDGYAMVSDIGPQGARVSFARIAPPGPIYVEAPDHG